MWGMIIYWEDGPFFRVAESMQVNNESSRNFAKRWKSDQQLVNTATAHC